MNPLLIAAIGVNVIGGVLANKSQKKAAKTALKVGKANAADLERITGLNADEIRRISGLNADAVLQTASLNSGAIVKIAAANASAHISSTILNMDLASTEMQEMLRRHVQHEQRTLSATQAAYGASGVRLGSGSALEVIDEAITSGYGERQYLGNYAQKRLMMMSSEGEQRALLTMLDVKSRSKLLLGTAALQASITREEGESRAKTMLNDAEANAASLRRGGQLIAATARAKGTASLISGISAGLNTYLAYGATPGP